MTTAPAPIARAVTITVTATAVALGLMPVHVASAPAFVLSVIPHGLLARWRGASADHAEGVADDELFHERVDASHATEAERTPMDVDTADRRPLTGVVEVVRVVHLLVILGVAVLVLLAGADVSVDEAYRDQSWWVAGITAIVCLVSASWALHRRTSWAKRQSADHSSEQPGGSKVMSA